VPLPHAIANSEFPEIEDFRDEPGDLMPNIVRQESR